MNRVAGPDVGHAEGFVSSLAGRRVAMLLLAFLSTAQSAELSLLARQVGRPILDVKTELADLAQAGLVSPIGAGGQKGLSVHLTRFGRETYLACLKWLEAHLDERRSVALQHNPL